MNVRARPDLVGKRFIAQFKNDCRSGAQAVMPADSRRSNHELKRRLITNTSELLKESQIRMCHKSVFTISKVADIGHDAAQVSSDQ